MYVGPQQAPTIQLINLIPTTMPISATTTKSMNMSNKEIKQAFHRTNFMRICAIVSVYEKYSNKDHP